MIRTTVWPEVLELAQLLQDDGVAEVDVGRGRVDAELDAQRAALARGRELAPRARPAGSDVDGVAGQERRRRRRSAIRRQC